MKLAIISFTENGITLSDAVVRRADKRNVKLYTKCSHYMQEQESDAPELQKNAGGEKKKAKKTRTFNLWRNHSGNGQSSE